MWAVAKLPPTLEVPKSVRALTAVVLVALGVAVSMGGILSFRRARTTVNPLKPETTSALVESGIYAFTRNPMYLGMLLALLGWAVYLSSSWALLGPMLFVLYITRFQIIPEERALHGLFGAPFSTYKQRVRRWL
jgi:protein-S-isoprenylcysteine O-methyltransferase Ste14